ncbi:MAG: hypothetical protein AVDCRST_MAG13-2183, partial [uncultured Solirubrobacteraceae bacterium]
WTRNATARRIAPNTQGDARRARKCPTPWRRGWKPTSSSRPAAPPKTRPSRRRS